MTSKAIDKENSATFTGLSGAKAFGLSSTKSFVNSQIKSERLSSTPVPSLEKKALLNNVKELPNTVGKPRRALGDVLNTTSNRTKPKGGRTLDVNSTPSGTKITKSFSKLKLNETQQSTCAKTEAHEEEYPPVERFIGSKFDNFDDLFNDGRLSEFFLAPSNAVFTTNLNQRGHCYEADMEEKISIDDGEHDLFEMELKRVKKSLKNMEKKAELKSMEIECLESLMPKIWEDSFEEN
ncbi:hypothetical protein BpHYR1_029646 [Brachionus plicatilis]|uniref:Uncharacterized protein n=1 Tax=Brachionus plicatilis TaxID=10195 RepID=A0A3M7PTK5_BRAPC|nr:hypothetical protein BpHYR1_029646 [Brachionus plicatilis]